MLPPPARYFPIEKGTYEVAPGLKGLSQPMGNGPRDAQVFQFDSEFRKYRENKLRCRQEDLAKYHLTSDYEPSVSTAVNRFIVARLTEEHPEYFRWNASQSTGSLFCALTGETIEFDEKFELSGVAPPSMADVADANRIPYKTAFDALCSQIQEDVAVVTSDPDSEASDGSMGRDWLAAIHLCSPGHWAAADKIGKNFFDIHTPVAGIEKVNRAAKSLIDAVIHKGPYVRFVWGFGTDKRLNHHPTPPPGVPVEEWRGRSFRPPASQPHPATQVNSAMRSTQDSPFILRVERQVLWGLPEVRSSLFLIRVYFIDGDEIRRDPRESALLRSGLLSMTQQSRVYKGLDGCMDEVIAWLDNG